MIQDVSFGRFYKDRRGTLWQPVSVSMGGGEPKRYTFKRVDPLKSQKEVTATPPLDLFDAGEVPQEDFHPFSNGTQGRAFEDRNCVRCRLGPREDGGMRCELILAAMVRPLDKAEATRIGMIGNESEFTWDCPERIPGNPCPSSQPGE